MGSVAGWIQQPCRDDTFFKQQQNKLLHTKPAMYCSACIFHTYWASSRSTQLLQRQHAPAFLPQSVKHILFTALDSWKREDETIQLYLYGRIIFLPCNCGPLPIVASCYVYSEISGSTYTLYLLENQPMVHHARPTVLCCAVLSVSSSVGSFIRHHRHHWVCYRRHPLLPPVIRPSRPRRLLHWHRRARRRSF